MIVHVILNRKNRRLALVSGLLPSAYTNTQASRFAIQSVSGSCHSGASAASCLQLCRTATAHVVVDPAARIAFTFLWQLS